MFVWAVVYWSFQKVKDITPNARMCVRLLVPDAGKPLNLSLTCMFFYSIVYFHSELFACLTLNDFNTQPLQCDDFEFGFGLFNDNWSQ